MVNRSLWIWLIAYNLEWNIFSSIPSNVVLKDLKFLTFVRSPIKHVKMSKNALLFLRTVLFLSLSNYPFCNLIMLLSLSLYRRAENKKCYFNSGRWTTFFFSLFFLSSRISAMLLLYSTLISMILTNQINSHLKFNSTNRIEQ